MRHVGSAPIDFLYFGFNSDFAPSDCQIFFRLYHLTPSFLNLTVLPGVVLRSDFFSCNELK
jgi:hypothetical protein